MGRTSTENKIYHSVNSIGLPAVEDSTFLIFNSKGRYTVFYDTMYRQPVWVAYMLTSTDLNIKNSTRKNKFVTDTFIVNKGWAYATAADYVKSGYDRGHLLPSADRNSTQEENDATFLMSNISPQTPSLNRKIWSYLERDIRKLALKYDTLYIVTGPDLKGELKRLGDNSIGIPERFFKTILTRSAGQYYAVAFIIPNSEKFTGSHWDYVVTVREAERLLGYDFFYNLPVDLQDKAEASLNMDIWKP